MPQESLPFDLPGPGHRTLREICAERVLPEGSLRLLNAQVERVYELMRDGEWHKAQAILEAAGGSEGLRRMRALRGLGFTVDRRSAGGRTFEYRLSFENSDTPKKP